VSLSATKEPVTYMIGIAGADPGALVVFEVHVEGHAALGRHLVEEVQRKLGAQITGRRRNTA
jgi:hypothetical protein